MSDEAVVATESDEKDALIFVSEDSAPEAVKEMVQSGRIIFKAGIVAIGAESSPTGKRLEGPFAPVTLKDEEDSEAVLALFKGDVAKRNAYAVSTFNTRRKLQARLDLEAAHRGPEWGYIKQARAFVKMESDGQKIPKKYRGLNENQIAILLYDEANEE